MKRLIVGVLLAVAGSRENAVEVQMLPGEHWWAGVISESHRMPFTAESKFEFDFYANTAGNQGQPLLVSDKGRFLWCDEPFAFRIAEGIISAKARSGTIVSGEGGRAFVRRTSRSAIDSFRPQGRRRATSCSCTRSTTRGSSSRTTRTRRTCSIMRGRWELTGSRAAC